MVNVSEVGSLGLDRVSMISEDLLIGLRWNLIQY